jgi:acyl carrier protein
LGSDATGPSAPLNRAVEILLKFVNEDLLTGSQEKVAPDTALFNEGRIDSLKILRLIAFLEVRSGKKIPDELIVMDRFRTIETIAKNFPER